MGLDRFAINVHVKLRHARVAALNDTNTTSTVDPYIVMADNTVINDFRGRVCVGLRPLEEHEYDTYSDSNPPGEPGPSATTFKNNIYHWFISGINPMLTLVIF